MLHLAQRYLMGICVLMFLILSVLLFFAGIFPDLYPMLTENGVFLPLMDLFLISGAGVSVTAILGVLPFVTEGREILRMPSVLEHPGIHVNIMMLALVLPLYYYTKEAGDSQWQLQRISQASLFLSYIAGASIFNVFIGFYAIKKKEREKARDRKAARTKSTLDR